MPRFLTSNRYRSSRFLGQNLSDNKVSIECTELKTAAVGLFIGMLSHGNAIIRCGAAQALGRCGQILGDGRNVAEIAQQCFEKVKTARDALSRTGHSFALGCLHRHAGTLGSTQHLNTTISILLALSQDNGSPVVQAWALQSLTLIADSGESDVLPCFLVCVHLTVRQTEVERKTACLCGAPAKSLLFILCMPPNR